MLHLIHFIDYSVIPDTSFEPTAMFSTTATRKPGMESRHICRSVNIVVLLLTMKIAVAAATQRLNCTGFGTINNDENGRYRPQQHCDNSWRWDDYYWEQGGFGGACESPTENFRGQYCASVKTCTFRFYKVVDSSTTDQDDTFLPYGPVNGLCIDENALAIDSLEDYVMSWPDACVGDFDRCYSISKHKFVYLSHFCSKEWNEIPTGATHLSVNCTKDKAAKKKIREKQKNKEKNRNRRRTIGRIVGIVVPILVVLIGLFFFRRWWSRQVQRALRDSTTPGNERQNQDGTEVTLCSMMICGYWCLIKKVLGSTRWERDGLLQAHHGGATRTSDEETTSTVSNSVELTQRGGGGASASGLRTATIT